MHPNLNYDPYRLHFLDKAEYSLHRALEAYRTGLTTFNDLHHSHFTQNYWDKQYKDMGRLYEWTPTYIYPEFDRTVHLRSHYQPSYRPKYA
jgi:cytosine/adenosine deaminase-related metal-dependent hydrolase